MRRSFTDNRLRSAWTVQCIFLFPLLVLFGCQPAGPVTPVIIETVDLPHIDASTFESEVLSSAQPVLVEVAVDTGCPACEAMKPRVAEVARKVEGKIKVVRLDHRSNRDFAQQIGAAVCPSYLIFDQGSLVDAISGQTSADILFDRLYSHAPQIGSSKTESKEYQKTDAS